MLNDFLNDRPIKCFYSISFNKTSHDIDNNKSGVHYVQSESRRFYKGDLLPTKTSYYHYPDDFYIYDYTSSENIIHIVKDNRYQGYKDIDSVDIDYANSYIVNMNGLEVLDIKSKNDLHEISKHWAECKINYDTVTQKYFPQGIMSMFMTNTNTFNKVKPLYDKETEDILNEFKIIWVMEDEFYIEKKYGVLIESIKNVYWDIKSDNDLTEEEKLYSLSLVYDELNELLELHPDAKERYLKAFHSMKEVYINNILSMVDDFIGNPI